MEPARQFAQHPQLSGWAYGLWEDLRGGQRALSHDGGGKGYRALLYLFPAQDVGFFLAYNLADKHDDGELQEVFIERFRRRFFPMGEAPSEPIHSHAWLAGFAGEYRYIRRARSTMEKLISLVNNVRIDLHESGRLIMAGSSRKPVMLTAIGPLVFRRSDDRGLVAFDSLEAGRPQRLIIGNGFPMVYDRVSGFATLRVQAAWLLSMSVVFLYAAAWRPAVAMVRKRGSPRWDATTCSAWLGGFASALNLLFAVTLPWTLLGHMEGGLPEFVYGTPAATNLLLLIPPFTGLLAVAACIAVVRMWKNSLATPLGRSLHSVVAIMLLAFAAFASYWNLMGPKV